MEHRPTFQTGISIYTYLIVGINGKEEKDKLGKKWRNDIMLFFWQKINKK